MSELLDDLVDLLAGTYPSVSGGAICEDPL